MKIRLMATFVAAICMIVIPAAEAANDSVRDETNMRSTDSDPIGDWIEKNAERFDLIVQPKKKKEKVIPTRPASPKQGLGDSEDLIEKFIVHPILPLGSDGWDTPTTGESPLRTEKPENKKSSHTVYVPAESLDSVSMTVPKKVFAPPPEALKSGDAAAQIAAVMKDLDFSKKCSKFASSEGFGAWGEFIVDELKRGKGDSMLEGTADLRTACPAYDDLAMQERAYVWVKIFASMSMLESSCDPTQKGRGPNGVAAGLLQLHQGRENLAAAGCKKFDSNSALGTLRFAMSMLGNQIDRSQALFSSSTYWGVLRPQGDMIRTRKGAKRVVLARTIVGGLKELPFCQRK